MKHVHTCYYFDDSGEEATVVFQFRANRKEKAALGKTLSRRVLELQGRGLLPIFGRHCGHCCAGWDCCGRMFPEYAKSVRFVRRGIVVELRYARNV